MNAVVKIKSVDECLIDLKRAHVRIMKHKKTYLYSGVLLLGKSEVREDIPTAYTDGVNKFYGTEFMSRCTIQQIVGLVLHENFHVVLKQLPRFKALWKRNPKLANVAADYVVNALIWQLAQDDPQFVQLPPGALFAKKFIDWSTPQVFRYLDTGEDKDGKQRGKPTDQGDSVRVGGETFSTEEMDEHDVSGVEQADAETTRKMEETVDQAIQQSALMAGAMGLELPRAISELLEVEENWQDVLREYVANAVRGRDEYSYRRFNTMKMADDLYRPSTITERVGRILIANDTSGSISSSQMNHWASSLASICEQCSPDEVRVLWWDTKVHGEQKFESNYDNIASLLKPMGGGGTRVGCVSDYITERHLDADCLIIFTDGWVESDIKWNVSVPTLWVVTNNTKFVPPCGRVVKFKE